MNSDNKNKQSYMEALVETPAREALAAIVTPTSYFLAKYGASILIQKAHGGDFTLAEVTPSLIYNLADNLLAYEFTDKFSVNLKNTIRSAYDKLAGDPTLGKQSYFDEQNKLQPDTYLASKSMSLAMATDALEDDVATLAGTITPAFVNAYIGAGAVAAGITTLVTLAADFAINQIDNKVETKGSLSIPNSKNGVEAEFHSHFENSVLDNHTDLNIAINNLISNKSEDIHKGDSIILHFEITKPGCFTISSYNAHHENPTGLHTHLEPITIIKSIGLSAE